MINYRKFGDYKSQKVLVFIHGLATDGTIFDKIINSYFAGHYLVLVPDLRGCGLNSSIKGEHTINESAKDIVEILNKEDKKISATGIFTGRSYSSANCKIEPPTIFRNDTCKFICK